ncbi:MAG: MmgE/PrpD family protein, partial [Pirellulales bacterium]
HSGWAAHAGITAAQLAQTGLTGPPTVLEGRFGFYRAFSEGRFDQDALIGGLGDRWETLRILFKPYPTNHFTHAGIDAALELRRQAVSPKDITELELGVPAPVLRTIAEPPDLKATPETPHAAKFSGPFTVATALIGGGGLGVAELDFTAATIRDPEHLRLAKSVRCFADEEATDAFPHQFPAVLRARLSDGSVKEHRIVFNRGGPKNPLTAGELTAKFELNAAHHLAPEDAQRLAKAIWELDSAENIQKLLDLTKPSSPTTKEQAT